MKTRFYQIMAISALCLAATALAVALWTSARAQDSAPEAALAIPTTLNYQGHLREPDGSLTTGAHDITARIYNIASGGDPLYTTTLLGVTVRDGLFNIVLGDDPPMPDTLFAAAPLYIGISLDSNPELIPRQRLHAVPWAFQASTLVTNAVSQTVQGLTSNGNVTVNGDTTLNGSATVSGDTAIGGSANVSGDTAIGGSATVSGNLTVTGNLAHPGEVFVGPHFLAQSQIIKQGETCPPTLFYVSYDASAYVPEGATALLIEYKARAHSYEELGISILTDGYPVYVLAHGSASGDDLHGWGGQGIYPVNADRIIKYWIHGGTGTYGFDDGCEIKLIGYFK